jgi:hypothetical protein
VVGSIVHRRFDCGLGEIACFRALARLVENLINTPLFLDRESLEDGPACLSFGRDFVATAFVDAADVEFRRRIEPQKPGAADVDAV